MSVVIFIIILGFLIFIHELGHFIFAKLSGAKVDEFCIGFPPRIFTKKYGETDYSIGILPIGGFVKIVGENGENDTDTQIHENDPNVNNNEKENREITPPEKSLANKPRYIQALVMFAGVLFNIIGAWFLIVIGSMIGLPTEISTNEKYLEYLKDQRTIISVVQKDSPADLSGLKQGDIILKIKNPEQELLSPQANIISDFIAQSQTPIDFEIKRQEEITKLSVSPILLNPDDENKKIGIGISTIGTLKLPLLKAIPAGTIATWNMTKQVFLGFVYLVKGVTTGRTDILNSVAGPVGIAGLVKNATEFGFGALITLTAMISINLAIINLLPLPALDGGRLVMIGIEGIIRKKIKAKITGLVNGIGLLLLLILMVLITIKDIMKLF